MLDSRRRIEGRATMLTDTIPGTPAGDGDMALRDAIDRALTRLDPQQREAFLLKHVEQLNYDEIAAMTGTGVSALKMRVQRARERLQVLLKDERHD
jgi:DNA-directed RNA polymerase specialized sigma24 family protein